MTGLPDGFSVELYLGGGWVDVTEWHVGETSTRIHQGRSSEYGDVSPGTLSFALRNEDGRFTPRSPVSPYYPDVVPGVSVRVKVTAGVTHTLFSGKVTAWEPSWPERGQLSGGVVQVSAVDALAELASTTLDDRWTEEARRLARAGSTWVDVPALAGESGATGLDNVGLTGGSSAALGTAAVESDGRGSLSFGNPDGLILSQSVTFAPADGGGQIVALTVQDAPGTIQFWLRAPDGDLARYQQVFGLYVGATAIGSLWLEPNGGPGLDLTVRTGTTTVTHTLVVDVQDAAWRHITLQPAATPTSTVITIETASTSTSVTAAWDMRDTTVLRWGARLDGYNFAATCQVAGPVVTAGATAVSLARGLIGNTEPVSTTYAALQSYVPLVTSWATDGAEDRTIGEPSWAGKSALDVLQQLARTVNGVAWCPGSGVVTLVMADVARPATPVTTLDVEDDLDAQAAPPSFRDASDSRPTRVKITYASGTVTAVDAAAEASGRPRVETEIDTCAADAVAALFAGDYVLGASDALRVSQVAVDLYSAVHDLWATFLVDLYPTQLFTLSGWPLAMAGVASLDVHAQGWDLDLSEATWRYTLDCSPAGLFLTGMWDGDDYGRWSWGSAATVTGGTAVGGTSNGTMVIAFTGAGLTLDPAMYPLWLDWDGEVVEIGAPPAGAASPQTVTTTARGALGTAAQVHLTGETVDVYHAAVFGF